MNNIEIGPQIGQTKLTAGLDYYKPTMSQAQHQRFPDEQVTFTFKNRDDGSLLTDLVDPEELSRRLERFKNGWQEDEIAAIGQHERRGGRPLFSDDFLDFLKNNDLPPVNTGINANTGDLEISTTGDWPLVTFWETIVMSEVNELYFENYIRQNSLDIMDVYDEGNRRLSEKIDLLRNRPNIKFAEFGTRRRFSYRWQRHVVERLKNECPDNLIGTSNVQLAEEFDLMPIGTYAHEMPMVYAALTEGQTGDALSGHNKMLQDWEETYGDNLSTALTDTFGSDFFFADFTPEQAKSWQGLRHDSGDPFAFGEQVIAFYESRGIDPTKKTIVFSDSLNIEKIVKLSDTFNGRIKLVYGWGTSLTNDLGIPHNNIVMKATSVNGEGTVKISDDEGKHTGLEKDIERYQKSRREAIGRLSLAGVSL